MLNHFTIRFIVVVAVVIAVAPTAVVPVEEARDHLPESRSEEKEGVWLEQTESWGHRHPRDETAQAEGEDETPVLLTHDVPVPVLSVFPAFPRFVTSLNEHDVNSVYNKSFRYPHDATVY